MAGLLGFLTFIQCLDRSLSYGRSRRLRPGVPTYMRHLAESIKVRYRSWGAHLEYALSYAREAAAKQITLPTAKAGSSTDHSP